MATYSEFIETKLRRAGSCGRDVDVSELHSSLFDWQARIVARAVRVGRIAVFADTGLGKTRMQVEWSRLSASRSLILAPLSVARQTVREAQKIGVDVTYARDMSDIDGAGVFITNYERASKFDPSEFGAVCLDESSILKSFTGSTRNALIQQWRDTPFRSSWSATPAPNDVTELCNQSEFLGVLPRNEMLAAYFVHDQDGWRLKGHAADPMFSWMRTWCIAARKPSDVGGEDSDFELPDLVIEADVVDCPIQQDGQLFATDLGGVGGRAKIRKATLDARIEKTVDLLRRPGQWIAWCGLNDEAKALAAAIPDSANVHGTLSPEDKTAAFEAFQDGDMRVLITKPSIAGFGMNFQNCHQMAFVGINDSWESYYQSIRRCWRFGQTHPVTAHIVVSELEKSIVRNIERKESTVAWWVSRLVEHMNSEDQP
jgi:hypothetical protein